MKKSLILVLLVVLYASILEAKPLQSLYSGESYLEVDSSYQVSVADPYYTQSFTVDRTNVAYIVKDFGADYFPNNVRQKFYFTASVSSFTGAGTAHVFTLTNTWGEDAYAQRSNHHECLTLYLYYDGNAVLWWEDGAGGHISAITGAGVMSTGVTYYFEIDYNPSSNICTVRMRTGSHYGTLVKTFTLSNESFTPSAYRYFYSFQSYASSTAGASCTGSSGHYFIGLPKGPTRLGEICQSNVVNNGSYNTLIYLSDFGTTPKAKVAWPTDHVFGSDVDMYMDTVQPVLSVGSEISVNYNYRANPVSIMAVWDKATVGAAARFARDETTEDFYAFVDGGVSYSDNLAMGTHINGMSVGSGSYGMFAYEYGGKVYVQRSTYPYMTGYNITNGLGTATEVKTLTGDESWTQLVYWWSTTSIARFGVFYTDLDTTNKLYYRDADYALSTFQAEQTVSSDLYSLSSFRCVHTQNNKHFVFFRAESDNKIYYSSRSYGTSATWSTPTLVNDDTEYDGDGYFTVVADHGHSEQLNIHYYNGTNIVSRTWNGSSWGSASTLISSPSIGSGNIQAPYETPFEYELVYETTTGGIDYKEVVLTPERLSTSGNIFTYYGSPSSMNQQNGLYAKTYNGKVFVGCTTTGGESVENIFDVSSETFDLENSNLSDYAYLDIAHNAIVRFVDNDGYAYISEGGRNYPGYYTDIPLKIYKSDYTIDNVNFSFDKSEDWTDISPTDTYGRGYKALIVDDDNVLYLLFSDADYAEWVYSYGIQEYRSGSWSTYIQFAQFDIGEKHSYLQSACLGKETSGQKSLHLFYGWRDDDWTNTTYGGSLGLNEFYYLKLVPDGEGGFDAYDSAGNSLTLPLDNLEGDVIYTQTDNYPTANTLIPGNLGQADVVGTDIPVVSLSMYTPGNGDPRVDTYLPGYYLYLSDGEGGWSRKTIADTNDGVPTNISWNLGTGRIAVTDGGLNYYVASIKDGSKIEQLGVSISIDGCDTFSNMETITSDSYKNHDPYLTPITASSALLMWVADVSPSHSEVLYDILYFGLEATSVRPFGCALGFPTCTVMSADHLYIYRSSSPGIDPGTATPLNNGSPISGSTDSYIDSSGDRGEDYYYLAVYYDSGDSELIRTEEINVTTLAHFYSKINGISVDDISKMNGTSVEDINF